jgi:serine protease
MPAATAPYSGRIIVRLIPTVAREIGHQARQLSGPMGLAASPDLRDLRRLAPLLRLDGLAGVLRDYPTIRSAPLVPDLSVETLLDREDLAAGSPHAPLRSMLGYYGLHPDGVRGVRERRVLLDRLNAVQEIDVAYWEPGLRAPASPWAVETCCDSELYQQGYLEGSARGINARTVSVWGAYDGAGVGFVDVEEGWLLNHVELVPDPPDPALAVPANPILNPPAVNLDDATAIDHGTKTLGVVLGRANQAGIIGVAPGAILRGVTSRALGPDQRWELAAAIVTAAAKMQPGDVLLIEVETVASAVYTEYVLKGTPDPTLPDALLEGFPVEIVDHWFDAIRLSTALGVVVVEPAGNGTYGNEARNLNDLGKHWEVPPDWLRPSLSRNDARLDSGAILVSGCHSAAVQTTPPAHRRIKWLNHGSRVDCYAWGENVHTSAYFGRPAGGGAEGFGTDRYGWYGGTSAASAIIAGAAILVQQMYRKTCGQSLSPTALRALLSAQSTGTPILEHASDVEVGVMPDLGKIAAQIGALPDVFIRDSVADDGTIPNALVFQSPDIIVRDTPLPATETPQSYYGGAGPLANTMPPNAPVRLNQDNRIYVRLLNRTPHAADNVRVRVYWSEASTLVAPADWRDVTGPAGIVVPSVPGDFALTVSDEFIWHPTAADLPVGHGCFVALVDHDLDPGPPLLPASDWGQFLAYVGANNNIAWRNFTVLQGNQPMAFALRGAPDIHRRFTFEFHSNLPKGARLVWDLPRPVARQVGAGLGLRLEPAPDTSDAPEMARLALPAGPAIRFGGIGLDARTRYPCRLHVETSLPAPEGGWRISLRQRFRGRDVGRITWELRG